jgi:tetratricopeptide (TPR) repeat protein
MGGADDLLPSPALVHHAPRRRGGVAARSECATADEADRWLAHHAVSVFSIRGIGLDRWCRGDSKARIRGGSVARIFISHSSANNDWAIQLRDWLVANGWDDIFLDLDPERGIAAGERWKEALQKAAQHCEAVVALISPAWLASAWCRPELNTAQLMGKKIIVLLIGSKPSEIPGDLKDAQYVNLIDDPDAYTRLKVGLKRAGLDPSSFPFEEGRRPYPGFPPFEEKDAAIFFGRDAQIVRGLDELRRLARTGVERMLIILGASGCGKSSFLRAGLWPRLKRDDRAWLPLATIRPERAVISGTFGLVEALYRIMNETPFAEKLQKQDVPRSRADIEEFVTSNDDGLLKILAVLKQAGHMPGLSGEATPPPTIVIPIDQGEELFNEEGHAETKRFINILSKTLAADRSVLALLTMRTDSFPQVQNDTMLAALPKEIFTLDKMLEGSYREVIEGPAALVKPKPLTIDPRLTEALLKDAAGQDALALLAFTLRYLYDKYQANNELSLESYEKLGRLKGVIETTVRQALVEGVAKGELPKHETAQLTLIRMAFIPHLARVNPAGQFVRRIATRAEIPTEARPLSDRLTEARLLIRDCRTVGGENVEVVEVAHEALLREWKVLNDALIEEREFLVAKGQLEQDVGEYKKTPERRKKGALLAGNKLTRAREWLISRPQDLAPEERRFIQASADAEAAWHRRLWIATAIAFLVLAASAGFAWLKWSAATVQAMRADRNVEVAEANVNYVILDLAQGLQDVETPDLYFRISLGAAIDQARTEARIRLALGEVAVAREELAPAYRKALETARARAAKDPGNRHRQREIAVILSKLGDALMAMQPPDLYGALISYREALDIVRTLAAEDPNNAKHQRDVSLLLIRVGDALTVQSDSVGALAAYRESLNIRHALAAIETGNTDSQRDLWVNLVRIGNALAKQDHKGALATYRESLGIARWLANKEPDTAQWQRDMLVSLTKTGDILKAQSDYKGALAAYREFLEIRRRLGELQWQESSVESLDEVGAELLKKGDLADALAAYRESLDIRRDLATKGPAEFRQNDVASSLEQVGKVLGAQRDYDGALAALRESLDIRRDLAADHSNTEWQRDLSISYDKIGDVLLAQGKLDEALKAYRDGLAIRERLTAADHSNTEWQRDLSISYNKIGDVLLAQGKLDEALKAYRDRLAIAERLTAADHSNTEWQNDLQYIIGEIGGLAYRFVLARNFAAALEAANQAISLSPNKIWLYSNRAHALMFLGRVGEAQALYLLYRGEKNVLDGKSWETVILQDFAELRKAGLEHPLMDEIEKEFSGGG